MKEKQKFVFSPSILADLAFLVLIAWIIIAFANPDRDPDSWSTASEVEAENHGIKLVMSADGNVSINGSQATIGESIWMYSVVMKHLEGNPGQTISLTTQKGVSAGDVVKMLDILRTVERDLRTTSPDYHLSLSVNAVASN